MGPIIDDKGIQIYNLHVYVAIADYCIYPAILENVLPGNKHLQVSYV